MWMDLQDRPTGAGPKPPEAAVIKSHGGERSGQRTRENLVQVRYRETNESKPADEVSKVSTYEVKSDVQAVIVKSVVMINSSSSHG